MEDKDEEIRELKERLARLENAPPQPSAPPPPVPPPATQRNGCGAWVIGGLAVLVVLYMVGQCSSGADGSRPGSTPSTTWTPPPGFTITDSGGRGAIAIEWVRPTNAECRGSGVTCFALNVVTERDCPRSLYASITLLDGSGNNIGWTNDTAQGVQAGEQTRLVFDTYERGAQTSRLAEINCY